MSQPSPHRHRSRSEARERRWLGPLLVLPLPVALLSLAAVHPGPRALVGLLAGCTGLLGWILTRSTRRPEKESTLILLFGLVALFLSAVGFIPVGAELRSALQTDLAHPVNAILSVAGAETHSIALDTHEAALAWGWAASCLVLCAGISSALRTRRRSLRLAIVLCASATGLVLLQVVQQMSDATSIFWISGIPAQSREPFFGTLVNPNHAGIFLAGCLPIGIGLTQRGDNRSRLMAIIATGIMAIGLWICGSRGAVLAGMGGTLMMALVVVRVRTRLWILSLVGLGSAIVVGLGAQDVFVGLSEALMPSSVAQDAWSLRPEIWADTLTLVEKAGWTGVGLGSFECAFPMVKSIPQFTSTSHAHGEALQVLAETGIPTGVLWILVAAAPSGIGWRHAQRLGPGRRQFLTAGFLGAHSAILIGCLFDFPLRIGAISIFFASVCGVLLARPGSTREAASPRLQKLFGIGIWTAAFGTLLPILALLSSSDSHLASVEGAVAASDRAWETASSAPDPEPHLLESAQTVRSALARAPLDHRLLLRLGRAQGANGELDDALYTLSLAQQSYPTLPWPWFSAARIHSDRRELDSAQHAWRRGLSLDLPSPEEGSARVEEALADAPDRAAVLAMIPERADRLRDAAAIVSRFQDRSLARRLFDHATELDPRVNLSFANHLVRWGEPEEAWERIQRVPNRHCHTVRTGGKILLELQKNAEAVTWLEDALGTCGAQDSDTLIALAKARAQTKDPRAAALIERLLEEHPDNLELLQLKLKTLRDRRLYAEMIPILEERVLEGLATDEEVDDLMRLYEGLPLR